MEDGRAFLCSQASDAISAKIDVTPVVTFLFEYIREEERDRAVQLIKEVYAKTEAEFGAGQYPGSGNLIGALLGK